MFEIIVHLLVIVQNKKKMHCTCINVIRTHTSQQYTEQPI